MFQPNFSPPISSSSHPAFGPYENLECISYSQVNLVNEMRYLWLQMVMWSRSYISNCAVRQDALEAVYERLYSVPAAFYNYMNTFYGPEIAEQYIHLLSRHVILFTDLINAMYVGNQPAANISQTAWFGNADSIALFMTQISGSWNYQDWHELLVKYQKMLIEEAIAILSSNYRSEIAIYDRLQYHSMRMADYMSKGVMNNLLGNVTNRPGLVKLENL